MPNGEGKKGIIFLFIAIFLLLFFSIYRFFHSSFVSKLKHKFHHTLDSFPNDDSYASQSALNKKFLFLGCRKLDRLEILSKSWVSKKKIQIHECIAISWQSLKAQLHIFLNDNDSRLEQTAMNEASALIFVFFLSVLVLLPLCCRRKPSRR